MEPRRLNGPTVKSDRAPHRVQTHGRGWLTVESLFVKTGFVPTPEWTRKLVLTVDLYNFRHEQLVK